MRDRYRTLSRGDTFTLKEKRSEFIATAAPAATTAEAKAFIESTSKKYSDARHNCWAYRVEFPNTAEHSSDDGEPSGTAGRPILGAMAKADLYDLAVVVTRYFGGIKLGIRGLMDAYSAAAAGVMELCEKTEKTMTTSFVFETGYDGYKYSLRCLEALGLEDGCVKSDFGEKVISKITVPASLTEEASKILRDLEARSIIFKWRRI